jgi:hypothetical protein
VGEGLIVDSLVKAFGRDSAAVTAASARGGTLRVVNSTAISTHGPALASSQVASDTGPVAPNDLVVTNAIARGTTDVQAPTTISCVLDGFCDFGIVHIDHSDFVTRVPAASERSAALITEGPGNIAGDPLFANAANDDYHLLPGSPAIDVGVAQDLALPTDLDGLARLQGGAPDLGAFETSPPAPDGGGDAGGAGTDDGGAGPPPVRAAVLSGLRVTPSRFRSRGPRHGTRIRFRLDQPSGVTLTFRRVTGKRRGGVLTIAGGRLGANTVRFSGRLHHRALSPGRYRLTARPTGGRARTATFRILARR